MKSNWLIIICVSFALGATGCGRKAGQEPANEHEHEHGHAQGGEEQHGEEHAGTVRISADGLKLVTIETLAVARGNLPTTIHSAGRISFNANQTAKVTSTFEGRIRQMNQDIGAQVKTGDVMALIESPELLNKPLELKAPISGQVIERHGTVGEAVDKTRELYTISDLKNVWGIAEIKERDIAAVRVGQDATLRVLAYPSLSFTGKVTLVGHEVEEKTRTVEARIEVDNADEKLKPGMFADVEIITSVVGNVIAVPDEALQTFEDQQIVFVVAGTNEFAKRAVKVGIEQNGQSEIVEGLNEGDRVVTKGSFILKSELLKAELAEGGHSH